MIKALSNRPRSLEKNRERNGSDNVGGSCFAGWSKMPRCKASEIPRSETYFVAYVAATRDEATQQMGVFHQPQSPMMAMVSISMSASAFTSAFTTTPVAAGNPFLKYFLRTAAVSPYRSRVVM